VTDVRTDGQLSREYYSGLHSEQCGRAVKILPASQYLVVFIEALSITTSASEETERGNASVSSIESTDFGINRKPVYHFQ